MLDIFCHCLCFKNPQPEVATENLGGFCELHTNAVANPLFGSSVYPNARIVQEMDSDRFNVEDMTKSEDISPETDI